MTAALATQPRAGSVPSMQGTALPQQEKRGPRGTVGTGTRADRVKAAWRAWRKSANRTIPLKVWAKTVLKPGHETIADDDLRLDLVGWLDVKGHIHTTAVRTLMKEAKRRKRSKPKKPSKDRRKVKGNSGKR